jgi:hypothetical protein
MSRSALSELNGVGDVLHQDLAGYRASALAESCNGTSWSIQSTPDPT